MKRERARRITPITVSFIPVKKRSVKIVVEDLPFNIENLNCARQVNKVNVVLLLIRATSNLSSVTSAEFRTKYILPFRYLC